MPSSGGIDGKNIQPDIAHQALPREYGETMAALMPRDPNWMFVYWEITPETKARITREHGPDVFKKSRQILRVYQAPPSEAYGRKYFDVAVRFDAGNWYVHTEDANRTYCCELGLVLPSGGYRGIVESNTVTLPAGRVSDVMDGKWMAVSGDFEKLLQLSGVEYIGRGSGEVGKSLAQRREILRAAFSSASSQGAGPVFPQAPQKPVQKKFPLVADCELILYGAAGPDSYITVSGRKVNLNPDGTFSLRFALPDGGLDLPVKALSKDGTEPSDMGIKVLRATATDGK